MNLGKTKIRAMLLLEVLGRPPEYLTEVLNSLIKSIGEEKGVIVKETKINPPVLMKEQKEFYTSFTEVEVEVEEILSLVILMFKYMPAHIEIISPQNISLTNSDLGDTLSELTRRLHGYDEMARILQTEKSILEKKLKEILEVKQEGKSEIPAPEESDKKEENTNKKEKSKRKK